MSMRGVLSVVVLVILATSHTTEQDVRKTEILILGAGMSGISCAKTLKDLGIEEVLVLEGDSFIGGRMRTFEFFNYTLELGANWIEGLEDNPLWDLKQKYNMKGSVTDFMDAVVYDEKYNKFSFPEETPSWTEFVNALNYANDLSDYKKAHDEQDVTIRVALELGHWFPKTPVDSALEWTIIDFEFTETPDKISLKNGLPLEILTNLTADQFMMTDSRGYKYFVEEFANELDPQRILVNKLVKRISWDSSPIQVETSDGSIYEADHVVTTFSLGVLQNHDELFYPSLPEWKKEAILMYDMGVYTKIFLKFDEAFWDDREFIIYADLERGYYPYWQNMNLDKYFPGSNMIMVTVQGSQSKRIEEQEEEKTISELMDVLRGIYGADIPDPVGIKIPIWYNNPLFYGSYSNWPMGLNEDDVNDIRKPLANGTLHFAGEATEDSSGYVLSAMNSGNRVAKEIAERVFRKSIQ